MLLRKVVPLALLLALVATAAHGSVARAVSFEEKVTNADSIIYGSCKTSVSEWDPSRRFIVTKSTFEVRRALKGSATGEVTVITPGGSVGGVNQRTIGVPTFQPGEQDVLFVKQAREGATVLYLDQGTYRVDDDGGKLIVRPAQSQLVLVDTQSGRAVAADSTPRSLEEFERSIRDVIRGSRTRDIAPAGAVPGRGQSPAAIPWTTEVLDFVRTNRGILILVGIGMLLAAIPLIRKRG